MTSQREQGPLFPRTGIGSRMKGHRFAIFKPSAASCVETPRCPCFPDRVSVQLAMRDKLSGIPPKTVTEGQTKPTEESASA